VPFDLNLDPISLARCNVEGASTVTAPQEVRVIARPRKYIQIEGQTIDGASLHKRTGRYYVLDQSGKRVYFKDWREARAAQRARPAGPARAGQLRDMDDVAQARMIAEAEIRRSMALQKLKQQGLHGRADAPIGVVGSVVSGGDPGVFRFVETAHHLADAVGVPAVRIAEIAKKAAAVPSPNNPRLSAVGETWLRHKCDENGQPYIDVHGRGKLKRSPLTKHQRDALSLWRLLITCVGDVRIAELQPDHFRRFFSWADCEAAKRSAHWHGQLMTAVGTIFRYCLQHYVDWSWPSGINERLKAYTPREYEPAESNAEPTPPDVFRAWLRRCDVWVAADPEELERSTQSGKARRLQAVRKRRRGIRTKIVLQLALNCGLNGSDFERIYWANLHLDEPTPFLELPRKKVRRSAGRAIDRRTPLVGRVTAALRAWRETEQPGCPDRHVLLTHQGTALNGTLISQNVSTLIDEAGLDHTYTFKHLRNVGPTLGFNAGLPEEMVDLFLGHNRQKRSSRFYRERATPEYVKPIVDLIEQAYFADAP